MMAEQHWLWTIPTSPHKDLPKVQILSDDGEGGLTRGETISLSDRIMKDTFTPLKIVKGILPSQLGVQVAHFFLEEK